MTYLVLVSAILEVFLELVIIHEVGEAGPNFRVFYSSGLQFKPEVRIYRQKQAIKPPVYASVRAGNTRQP